MNLELLMYDVLYAKLNRGIPSVKEYRGHIEINEYTPNIDLFVILHSTKYVFDAMVFKLLSYGLP